ncbi:hypothetical protein FVE85_3612 [Porphyridium purpureum]|uniref:Uncharacterized protein n=1 Tax=Porphyridium purpureum TaxID=35688 RepID=A0A5J4YN95_PORPP|nr:hypothetical protein FVE85_3612 [Porphyridium purpureum]|eukprot:POR1323..scf249_10
MMSRLSSFAILSSRAYARLGAGRSLHTSDTVRGSMFEPSHFPPSPEELEARKKPKKPRRDPSHFPIIAGAQMWPDRQMSDSFWPTVDEGTDHEEIKGPFAAIQIGADCFRGVVMSWEEARELTAGCNRSFKRPKDTLKEAMEFCLAPHSRACTHFFAFRYGCGGARGFTTTQKLLHRSVVRIKSPYIEKKQFNNTTQALIFCEQAGTDDTDWHTLERSIRYLVRNPDPPTLEMVRK